MSTPFQPYELDVLDANENVIGSRTVTSPCGQCRRTMEIEGEDGYAAFTVISPTGLAHVGADYGQTLCGRDGTKDGWLWPM